MNSGLRQLGVELVNTDFFITHLHADHFALLSKLATATSQVFFNRPETELIEATGWWERMVSYAGKNGFPENELREAIRSHPGREFGSEWIPEISILQDGDQISAGDYCFRCVSTPGHSLGHTCLYEPDKKILVAGDHILIDITPNIQCWTDDQNPLQNYLASLDKVNEMEIDLVLPGHRRLMTDHKKRIAMNSETLLSGGISPHTQLHCLLLIPYRVGPPTSWRTRDLCFKPPLMRNSWNWLR